MTAEQASKALLVLDRIAVALERIADVVAPKDAGPQPVPGACPLCQAAEDKQVDASTIASPHRKKCLVCQAEYDG